MRYCQSKEDCKNVPTHTETQVMGMMERKYSCCKEHCRCDWHDNDHHDIGGEG